jgi:hypothetical protein
MRELSIPAVPDDKEAIRQARLITRDLREWECSTEAYRSQMCDDWPQETATWEISSLELKQWDATTWLSTPFRKDFLACRGVVELHMENNNPMSRNRPTFPTKQPP